MQEVLLQCLECDKIMEIQYSCQLCDTCFAIMMVDHLEDTYGDEE